MSVRLFRPALRLAVLLLLALPGQGNAQDLAFDPAPLLARAGELLDSGDALEALGLYRQVGELAHTQEERSLALARAADIAALFAGDAEQALTLYEVALAGYAGQAELQAACVGSGLLLYESGRGDEAEARFKRCVEAAPQGARSDTARYMLGRIQRERAQGTLPGPGRQAPYALTGEPEVRVFLGSFGRVDLGLGGTAQGAGGAAVHLAPGRHVLEAGAGGVRVDGRDLGPAVRFAPSGQSFNVNGREYAGAVTARAAGGQVELVNRVPMETYLLGVVGREMGAGFAPQALRAQAVASRSYAASLLAAGADRAWDLRADTGSQVYGPPGDAATSVAQAVAATRGQLLLFGDAPALCYFHAHSGGVTEDDAMVWGSDLPYFLVQDDALAQVVEPLFWEYAASGDEIAQALRREGFNVARVVGVEAIRRSSSGRMAEVAVATDQGELRLSGNAFRLMLGSARLKSLLCVVRQDGDTFTFSGRGFGHGVGMSQWGAEAWAEEGEDYTAILSRYYPGTRLARLY